MNRFLGVMIASLITASAFDLPPLILVPGLTGSALEAQLNHTSMPHIWCKTDTAGKWMPIWLVPSQVIPEQKDCLLARMTLTYDAETDTYANLDGVDIRPVGFGDDTAGNKNLLYDYEFGTMVKSLSASLGYEAGRNLFLAPYDWRLAGDAHAQRRNGLGGFYVDLKQLIENKVHDSGSKAVLVSHSLGCPTLLYFFHKFVSESWRADYIRGWIAISGPFLGSSMQANAYLGGYTFGVPSWLLPHDYVRPVQTNASSGAWLSPSAQAFGDLAIVKTPNKNYTAADLPELLKAIGNNQAVSVLAKDSLKLEHLQSVPANVDFQHWYSNGVKTALSFEYSHEIEQPGFNEAPSTTHYGDGDGIVNEQSLRSVERFWNVTDVAKTVTLFPNASHFGMLSDKRVLESLANYLNSSGGGGEQEKHASSMFI